MNTTNTINSTAALIAEFDPMLAKRFISDWWMRVDLAYAFARSMASDKSDDVNPIASLVIRVAINDRDMQQARDEARNIKERMLSL